MDGWDVFEKVGGRVGVSSSVLAIIETCSRVL